MNNEHNFPSPETAFRGETYTPRHDFKRLRGVMLKVISLMADGKWRTLKEISEVSGGSEASVSARLRDLRRPEYGSNIVDRYHTATRGTFQYRVRVTDPTFLTHLTGRAPSQIPSQSPTPQPESDQ